MEYLRLMSLKEKAVELYLRAFGTKREQYLIIRKYDEIEFTARLKYFFDHVDRLMFLEDPEIKKKYEDMAWDIFRKSYAKCPIIIFASDDAIAAMIDQIEKMHAYNGRFAESTWDHIKMVIYNLQCLSRREAFKLIQA